MTFGVQEMYDGHRPQIRPATLQDTGAVYRLVKKNAFQEDGSGYLLSVKRPAIQQRIKDGRVLVVESEDGCVVGTVSIVSYRGKTEARSYAVDSDYNNRGYGTALLAEATNFAVEKFGAHQVDIYIKRGDENGARKVAEKLGYTLADSRPIEKVVENCSGCPFYLVGDCKEILFSYTLNGHRPDEPIPLQEMILRPVSETA